MQFAFRPYTLSGRRYRSFHDLLPVFAARYGRLLLKNESHVSTRDVAMTLNVN